MIDTSTGDTENMLPVKELIAEVRKVAEANPDFIYSEQPGAGAICSYFGQNLGDTTGSPCIIGQALKNLKLDTSRLKDLEDQEDGSGIADVLAMGLIDVEQPTETEENWLGRVQCAQDFGESWATAVMKADLA